MISSRPFLIRKGQRSQALARAPLPAKNIGQRLGSESLPQLVDAPGERNEESENGGSTSPVTKVESRGSVCQISPSESDSISLHTRSSTTSIASPTEQPKFRSLAEQIADDDRREKAKEHLRRIMEEEEARIAEDESGILENDLKAGIADRTFPNALRLTFEPQMEQWDIDQFLLPATGESFSEGPPDYDTATASHRPSKEVSQEAPKSEETSSTYPSTSLDEKNQTPSTPPPDPGDAVVQRQKVIEEKTEQATMAEGRNGECSQEEGIKDTAPASPAPRKTMEAIDIFNDVTPNGEDSPVSKAVPNTTLPTQLHMDHERATSDSQIHTLQTEKPDLPAVQDTLFQDLNRLKLSSSLRQKPNISTQQSPHSRSQSSLGLPPSSRAGPASVFATVSPPQTPLHRGPVYKEILTPPHPDGVMELSATKSVQYKVRPPKVDEKYRRNRQHPDRAAYNTLPQEPYPLLPPEPRFEAHPSEEDLRHLQHSRSPRAPSIALPDRKSTTLVSIEPDIDPRTGRPWHHRWSSASKSS